MKTIWNRCWGDHSTKEPLLQKESIKAQCSLHSKQGEEGSDSCLYIHIREVNTKKWEKLLKLKSKVNQKTNTYACATNKGKITDEGFETPKAVQ